MTTRHDKMPDFVRHEFKYLGVNPFECPQETDYVQTGRCFRTCWNLDTNERWDEDSSD